MCGILAIFGYAGDNPEEFRKRILALSKRIRHRGPDWGGIEVIDNKHFIAHERLAIVDVESGAQPLKSPDGHIILTVNGEIYNHLLVRQQMANSYEFQTGSDCEVIIPLFQKYGEDCMQHLDGYFAFSLYDGEHFLAARDPIGITTLYLGRGSDGSVWISSEMKCLIDDCEQIEVFLPGHYVSSRHFTLPLAASVELSSLLRRWYNPAWFDTSVIPTRAADYSLLRTKLEAAVRKRMMADVPYGVLLSGGLDSSLIAAITCRIKRELSQSKSSSNTGGLDDTWSPRLHSFSIGLKGAPDLAFAQRAANFLGTIHHEWHFTISEGLDAVPDVIWHLETYDVTTVRASTPMYLLSRKIRALGVKMVLSGEGSDEVFGGYLYFHSAPDAAELHRETVSRVRWLHYADCLRANKSTMAFGVEVRVPFLDKQFLDEAMTIDPSLKLHSETENGSTKSRMEKWVLRKAFDTPEDPYLPDDILWRQKEQFSDGVGYSWIDTLKSWTAAQVSDEDFARRAELFPHDTPDTKEGFYYRTVFERQFPPSKCLHTVRRWIPRTDWGCPSDPSGRAQKVHLAPV